MITLLHVMADLLLFTLVIVYDRRIAELEENQEVLARRVERLSRRRSIP